MSLPGDGVVRPVGVRPRVGLFALLALMMASGTIGTAVLGVFAPLIIAEFGLTRTAFGLFPATVYLIAMLCSRPFGRVVDRVPPVRLVVPLFLVSFGAIAMIAAAYTSPVVLLGAFGAGLALGLSNPVTNALIAGELADLSPGTAMGMKQAGGTLMLTYVGLFGPTLAMLWGWRVAAALLAGLMLVGALVGPRLLAAHRRVERGHRPSAPRVPAGPVAAQLWVRHLGLYCLAMGVATATAGSYYVLYAHEQLGFSTVTAGLAASVMGACSIFARFLWVKHAERRPVDAEPLVAIGAIAVVSTLVVLAAPLLGGWAMWPAVVGTGVSMYGWNAVAMLLVIRLADGERIGHTSGVVLLPFFLGLATAPVAFGVLTDLSGTFAAGWGLQLVAAASALAAALRLRTSLGASA